MSQYSKQEKYIHHPHDKLVVKMLSDISIAICFLKKHLPKKWLAKLDLSTLQLSSETSVSAEWKKHYSDIVFCCKRKDKSDSYVYILLEHLSSPKKFTPVRSLEYNINFLGKSFGKGSPPDKLPNYISIVLYHGDREYPYEKEIFSCFEDEELARESFIKLIFVDLAKITEEEIVAQKGKDIVLKLLLKYSRSKNFVKKLAAFMRNSPETFISLSCEQAQLIYEYSVFFGKGNPENVKMMQTAFRKTYGNERSSQFFSIADLFHEEGRNQGILDLAKELKSLGVSQEILTKAQEKAEKMSSSN